MLQAKNEIRPGPIGHSLTILFKRQTQIWVFSFLYARDSISEWFTSDAKSTNKNTHYLISNKDLSPEFSRDACCQMPCHQRSQNKWQWVNRLMCCIRKEGFEVLAGGYKVFLRHVSLITTVSYAPSHNSKFTRRVHLIMSVCCARTVQNDSCKHHMESTWDGPHCASYQNTSVFEAFFYLFFFWPPNLCAALVISLYLQIGPDGSANWKGGDWPVGGNQALHLLGCSTVI